VLINNKETVVMENQIVDTVINN